MHTARVAPEKAVSPARSAAVSYLPGLTEQPMGKTTYQEQLLDPRWQRKRLERMGLSDFACDVCGDRETTLHVHHKEYVRGRAVWDYTVDELQTLCKNCHSLEHAPLVIRGPVNERGFIAWCRREDEKKASGKIE